MLVFFLSLLSTLVLLIAGLILGFRHTENVALSDIFNKIDFLLAYFIEVFTYLGFAFLIGLLMKRAGLAIGLLFIYTPFEAIISWKIHRPFSNYFPIEAMNQVIRLPKTQLMSLFGFNFQNQIKLSEFFICVLWAGVFILISFFVIRKKDL